MRCIVISQRQRLKEGKGNCFSDQYKVNSMHDDVWEVWDNGIIIADFLTLAADIVCICPDRVTALNVAEALNDKG